MKNGVVKYNIGSEEPEGEEDPLSSVSMNYWGFHPSIFKHIEDGLFQFMKNNSSNPTAEYYIPDIVTQLIQSNESVFNVIPTEDNWFGVTYKEDKQMAVDTINSHISNGIYPSNLWELSIAQHVFSYYFEEAQVIDYSVINNGLINKTYKLDTSQGVYILQEINQDVFKEPELALENIKRVSSWLNEHEFNYSFPTPIHFTYQFYLINCGDYYLILMLHPIMKLRTKKW